MGKRHWEFVAGWLIGIAALTGAGVLVYRYWDILLAAVLSPIGGLVAKVLFSGKFVKILVAASVAAVVGVVAARRRLRGSRDPEQAAVTAPPVYGPPAAEAGPAREAGTAPTNS